ncbi:GntR family transcriptional regulator [Nocardia bhagyanarayanae]|uniref:GntR family transcriptional regulator n=1 Tax=Nocardia bhagyanarayanae TaxID=1215925 RepID=A0A543F8Q4_9NOCA|nr:GntR family transcriptional regulator [Nocardia bhagyanarayanae]TQM30193.1 GntR family transcriptional regulator [Nocardia bhagyanarayanae]
MPDIEEVLPKYQQISGYIRDQIERGELAPGAEVPSERELAAAWKVARPTAAKALNTLRQQGLVESRRGSGTFVRGPDAVPLVRESAGRARQYGGMYAEREPIDILAAELVDGPEYVTAALGLELGSEVIARRRLITGENGDAELSTSWFAGDLADVADRLLDTQRLPGGTATYLEAVTGRRVASVFDQVSARMATTEERKQLRLARTSAVLVYRLTAIDTDGVVLQFDEGVYPPESWLFRQEYSVPGV